VQRPKNGLEAICFFSSRALKLLLVHQLVLDRTDYAYSPSDVPINMIKAAGSFKLINNTNSPLDADENVWLEVNAI
jgi:hypothetical protein